MTLVSTFAAVAAAYLGPPTDRATSVTSDAEALTRLPITPPVSQPPGPPGVRDPR